MIMENLLSRKLLNFVKLDAADLELLDRIVANPRTLPARMDLILEGEAPTDVHLILKGFACRYKLVPDGGRQIMAYLVPGDICDLHVFLLEHMDHSLATLSECTVVDIQRDEILAMLARPRLAQALLLSAMVDEGTLREWVVNLGRRQGEERVAHLLCELLSRLRAVGLVSSDSYRLPITQLDLAGTVGQSAVHVNRVLKSLRASKLITLEHSNLVILDLPALEKLAGWNPNYLHLRRMTAAQV
jgi:CRP-like cAMP-binding protein